MAPEGWIAPWPVGSAFSEEVWEEQVVLAAGILHALSGRVFGVHTDVVRPVLGSPNMTSAFRGGRGHRDARYWWPGLFNGGAGVSGACGCASSCGCLSGEVMLPGPVDSIIEVRIDGELIPEGAYRVRNRRWLRRVDGLEWPATQDLDAPDDGVGAFVVRYKRGVPVPEHGLVALRALAADLSAAAMGGPCKVPQRAQSVARQGMNVEMIDVYQLFEHGLTGVPAVDRWLISVNPSKSTTPSRVFSVDTPGPNRLRR